MSNKIQLKRGIKANLPALSIGEGAFTTDTKELFVGDGTSNILINSNTANTIMNYGGNGDGITANDLAFTNAKVIGKVFFPQNIAKNAIYYFTSNPNMDGIIISSEKGVKLSFPTTNGITYKNVIFENDMDIIFRDRDNTGSQLINNYSKSLYNIAGGNDLSGHVKPTKVLSANINRIMCSTTSNTIATASDTTDIKKSATYQDYYYVYPSTKTNDPNTFYGTTVAVSDSDMVTSAFNAFVDESDATSRAGAFAIDTTASKFIFFSLDITKKLYVGYNNVGTWSETSIDLSSILTDAYSIAYGFVMSVRYVNNIIEIYMNGARIYTYSMPFPVGRIGFGINCVIGASIGINNLQWSDILQEQIEKSSIADTQNLLVSGDSITFGEGASVSWANFLPNLLEGKRGIQKVNVNNIAVSGTKVDAQLTLLQSMDLSSYTAFLAMIGTNDIQSATNYTTFKTNLQSIVALANGRPVILGLPPMFISRTLTGVGYATANYNKGAMIREAVLSVVGDNSNVYLADTLSSIGRIGIDNALNVLRDNIHLISNTELLIAKCFAKTTITALANDKLNIPITTLNNGGYQVPTLSNSWVNNGGGYENIHYYKDGSGIIHIDGIIRSGTWAVNTTLFTLAVGYRPSSNKLFNCPYSGGSYVIQVLNTGIVSIFTAPTPAPSAWIGLNGISFRTD